MEQSVSLSSSSPPQLWEGLNGRVWPQAVPAAPCSARFPFLPAAMNYLCGRSSRMRPGRGEPRAHVLHPRAGI